MRFRALTLVLATVSLSACGTAVSPAVSVTPTTVGCTDAARLKQQSIDDRRRSDELKSDHERIYIGNRAGFFASLAIVADLTCLVTLADAEASLTPALEAARKAETTRSMYERAFRWSEANFIASQVIAKQIQRLPVRSAAQIAAAR
jgi:hypothetical protein